MFDAMKTQYEKRLVIGTLFFIWLCALLLYLKLFTFQYCNTESLVQRLSVIF